MIELSKNPVQRGGNISLTKTAPGLTHLTIGLGWDIRTTDGAPFDLDSSVILCGADGKALSDMNFVFYNNPKSPDGSVVHLGDNRTGAGDGDDEQLSVDLNAVPAEVAKIVVLVSIDQADERRQNFGMVSGAYVRGFDTQNPDDASRAVHFDLGEDAATETALVFAEVYRNNGEWKFRAIGQGYSTGLVGIIRDYGLNA